MGNKKWYQKSWGIILILFLFFPIGIFLMWKHSNWNKLIKIIITIILVFPFIIVMFTGNSETSDNTNNTTENTTNQLEQSNTILIEDTTQNIIETTENIIETTENNSPWANQEKNIRKFVDEFNAISKTPITDIDFRNNHSIAYFVVDDYSGLSIKVNDNNEQGFMLILEFKNGKASLEKYENFIQYAIKVFDANLDIGDKLQEANANEDTTINLSNSISVNYHYIKDAVGYQAADTYIITLISTDYNKQ